MRRLTDASASPLTLGRFRLLHKLGEGGMGVVYAAEDLELRRRVAIKLLPDRLVSDPARRQRFMREARSAAQVNHPNIATIHEIGEDRGRVYIVMEYVSGESVRALLARYRPSVSQALRYAACLSAAVARAHDAGVIHRDLKPDNLMIDAEGQLKILDFGIAKISGEASHDRTAQMDLMTAEGGVVGTPGYMSPEQTQGLDLDTRSDIFSIGVILYELLTGVRPFQGRTPMEVFVATVRDEPPAPAALGVALPEAVEAVLRRCLAKDPAQRYQTAHELAAQLAQLSGETTTLPSASPRIQVAPASGAPATSGTGPTLPATTSSAGALIQSAAPAPKRSKRWLFAALAGALVLLSVAGVLVYGFASARQVGPAASNSASSATLREPKAGLAAIKRYESPRDSSASSIGSVPMWETAARDFAEAAKQDGAPARWHAAALFAAAEKKLLEGKLIEAEQGFRDAAAADPGWALPYVGLTSSLANQHKKKQALEAAQKAEIMQPDLWVAVVASAEAHAIEGEFDDAISEYRRALNMAPKSPFLLAELALAYHAAGMDEEATRNAELALKEDPDLVPAHILLSERALEKSDGKAALHHATRAIGVAPRNTSAWLAKGDALLLLGRRDEAKAAFEKSLALWTETKQRGAPESRLKAVDEALKAGRLPRPRVVATGDGKLSAPGPRSRPKPASGGGRTSKTGGDGLNF